MDEKASGRRIRRHRERKAWTQEHLAGAAGVSVRTVQRAEEGVMSAETLSAIAGALDEPVEALTREEAGYPSVTPIVFYEDPKSLDWLVDVLGFEVRMKYAGPGGKIMHAELTLGDGVIMVGAPVEEFGWITPREMEGRMTQGIHLTVEDVDAHYARARDAGAEVLGAPEEGYGQRRYRLRDPEGHLWSVSAPVG